MSDTDKKNKKNKVTLWVVIVAIVLILLLLFWQFIATSSGDNDLGTEPVEAIAPMLPTLGL